MEWDEVLPYVVVGGAVLGALVLLRPQGATVITPAPTSGGDGGASEAARLALAERALTLAVERDIARIQAETELRGRQYELEARKQEYELEARRIAAEKEAAQSQAQASFWGTFWSGLFGLGGAILAGLSDEALYQRAIPDYIPPSGQLSALARREYGYRY